MPPKEKITIPIEHDVTPEVYAHPEASAEGLPESSTETSLDPHAGHIDCGVTCGSENKSLQVDHGEGCSHGCACETHNGSTKADHGHHDHEHSPRDHHKPKSIDHVSKAKEAIHTDCSCPEHNSSVKPDHGQKEFVRHEAKTEHACGADCHEHNHSKSSVHELPEHDLETYMADKIQQHAEEVRQAYQSEVTSDTVVNEGAREQDIQPVAVEPTYDDQPASAPQVESSPVDDIVEDTPGFEGVIASKPLSSDAREELHVEREAPNLPSTKSGSTTEAVTTLTAVEMENTTEVGDQQSFEEIHLNEDLSVVYNHAITDVAERSTNVFAEIKPSNKSQSTDLFEATGQTIQHIDDVDYVAAGEGGAFDLQLEQTAERVEETRGQAHSHNMDAKSHVSMDVSNSSVAHVYEVVELLTARIEQEIEIESAEIQNVIDEVRQEVVDVAARLEELTGVKNSRFHEYHLSQLNKHELLEILRELRDVTNISMWKAEHLGLTNQSVNKWVAFVDTTKQRLFGQCIMKLTMKGSV